MSSEDSTFSSESDSDSDPEIEESEVNTSGILFFKKSPNDESRLAKNSIIYKRNNIEKGLTKDKRATVQQVLDKRTYIRLKKLHGRGIFDYIYGVISTGKEANVYEAEGTLFSKKHRMAIKVYKTSILIFKDRSRYIEGEFRFRRSYVGTKNPRKMVSQWAEKEFRNLRRISLSGVYCPSPIALKDHILVMELIQDSDGSVSSKLKDLGVLPVSEWLSIYAQVISIMRILYQESKLIHADFSSYNLLYSNSKVIVIDVSQAVENDHPNAMYFLKRDCENITTFFTTINFDVENINNISNMENVDNNYNNTDNNIEDNNVNKVSSMNSHYNNDINNINNNQNHDNHNHTNIIMGNCISNGVPIPNNTSNDGINNTFNLLTSFQLFNFITMDMDLEGLCVDIIIDEDVDEYVGKMVFTSKNAKVEHLKETILRKRGFYNAFYRYVEEMILRRDPLIFKEECYESNNYISNEATWNRLKHVNISSLTVDTLEKLEKENNLPEINLEIKKIEEDYFDEDIYNEEKEYNNNKENNTIKDETHKFTGKIPEGITGKEWKKMVKRMNRERREHKIPKHIKKSFKHKQN